MQKMLSESGRRQYVIETALALLLVCLLITASSCVLMPFVGVLTYAVIIATATCGPVRSNVKLLNGRRRLAALLFGAWRLRSCRAIDLSLPAVADYVADRRSRLAARRQSGNPRLARVDRRPPSAREEGDAAMARTAARWPGWLQKYQPQLTAAGRWLLDRSSACGGGA